MDTDEIIDEIIDEPHENLETIKGGSAAELNKYANIDELLTIDDLEKYPFIIILIIKACQHINDTDSNTNNDIQSLLEHFIKTFDHNSSSNSSTADRNQKIKDGLDKILPHLYKKCKGEDILRLITTMLEIININLNIQNKVMN
jgi:hypothetical protein